MHSELIETMRDQVSTIYRAATGQNLDESQPSTSLPEASFEELTRSFAELEALARTTPALSERIPPFSFEPPLDARYEGEELVVEVAVPSIERDDVTVECSEHTLVISGIRRGHHGTEPGTYSHGEIPWGPFYRSFHVPFSIPSEPRVVLDRGLLRVHLKSPSEKQQLEEESGSTQQSVVI